MFLRFSSWIVLTVVFFGAPVFANLPYALIDWPKDDRCHLDNSEVLSEWWYYNGKLTASDAGKTTHFAYYITLQLSRQFNGHFPLLDVKLVNLDDGKVYSGNILLTDAQVSVEELQILSKHFSLETSPTNPYQIQQVSGNVYSGKKYEIKLSIPTANGNLGFDFILRPQKKPLYVGTAIKPGQIDMGHETNSFYYSLTRLSTEGSIYLGSKVYVVNSDLEQSRSWMDHQWGDFSLDQLKKSKWIWVGMQLSDGTDIQIGKYLQQEASPKIGEAVAAISMPNGSSTYTGAIISVDRDEKEVFKGYNVQIEDVFYKLHFLKSPLHKNHWMGVMSVNGKSVFEPNADYAIVENTFFSSSKY